MKELTIEEKAKRYGEALERAKKLQETCDSMAVVGWCEYIFPELKEKESKDDRTRKAILTGLIDCRDAPDLGWSDFGGINIDECIAWIEKQGKQPTDKVEPKFKVRDWVVLPLGIIAHIESLNSTDYQVTTTDGKNCDFKISKQDNYRLWSITDAKNGDLIYVSTEEKGIQAIFHEYKNDTIFFHCYLCTDFVQGGCMPIGSVELTYPLQKTHYNRFFEKMHEAGYEWDNEKKELRKIESKTLDAAKVIEWLRQNNCAACWDNPNEGVSQRIEQFKKDFEI